MAMGKKKIARVSILHSPVCVEHVFIITETTLSSNLFLAAQSVAFLQHSDPINDYDRLNQQIDTNHQYGIWLGKGFYDPAHPSNDRTFCKVHRQWHFAKDQF